MRLRLAFLLAAALAAPAAAQDAPLPIVDGPLEVGIALYTAQDVGTADAPAHLVERLFRVVGDGTSAQPVSPSACAPPCLASAERVTLEGGRLRPVSPDWPRLGWIVALSRGGARIEVDGGFVGRGSARLGVVPGSYDVSFWFGPGTVDTRSVTVPVANEVTVAALSARRAARRAAAAQMPQAPPPQGAPLALAAARSMADVPLAGWRMVQPEPEPEPPSAPPIEAAPAQPVMDDPPPTDDRALPSEPPPAEPVPSNPAATPDTPTAAASCTAEAAGLLAAVDALEGEGRYAEAQACLLRLARQDRGRSDLRDRLARLGDLKLAVDLLTAEERAELPALRAEVAAAANANATERLLAASARVLALVPGDIATMARLEGGFTTQIRPGGSGPAVEFTFVPGAAADPARAARLADRQAVPELGFLLGTTEVTNAQFAYFLNQIPATSDELYVVRDRRGIVLTRAERWEPARAAANLPATDATWHGAAAYAEWAGARLPTAEEWLWAFESGGGVRDGRDANTSDAGRRAPAAAGTFPADDLDLDGMVGNVWEWLAPDADTPAAVAPIGGGSFSTLRTVIASQPTQRAQRGQTDGHVGFRLLMPLGADG